MRELLETINNLTKKFDKELADSVLEVSVRANKQVVEELRGDGTMFSALLEIMEPEIKERERRAEIVGAVKALRQYSCSDGEIKEGLMKNYDLSSEEAESYLK